MKYLCLIYCNEAELQQLSQSDAQTMIAEYMAFTGGIRESGQYLGGNRLEPVHTATTVRVRSGKATTTDGPFAETKEQLGGYYLIEARDLNDAIQVASRIPGAKVGSIEIRPVAVSHMNPPVAAPQAETAAV